MKELAHRRRLFLVLATALWGCELHPAGEFTLSGWEPPPSPNRFARTIHPLLAQSCSAAACHGRGATFSIRPAPAWSGPEVESAMQLPEPLRGDYYLVLAFCNPQNEAESELLRWGAGRTEAHPGGAALTSQQAGEVLDWLEGRP